MRLIYLLIGKGAFGLKFPKDVAGTEDVCCSHKLSKGRTINSFGCVKLVLQCTFNRSRTHFVRHYQGNARIGICMSIYTNSTILKCTIYEYGNSWCDYCFQRHAGHMAWYAIFWKTMIHLDRLYLIRSGDLALKYSIYKVMYSICLWQALESFLLTHIPVKLEVSRTFRAGSNFWWFVSVWIGLLK